MNNNAVTGSYHDDMMVFDADPNCKKPSASSTGASGVSVGMGVAKGEARKSAAAAMVAAAAAAAAAGNHRLQQWLKETERQREENNRAAFARWMEKCDSGLVKPSTLQNYPTAAAAAAAIRGGQSPGAAAAAAAAAVAAAAAAKRHPHHHQLQHQQLGDPLDCGGVPDGGTQLAAALGQALIQQQQQQQQQQQPQQPQQQQVPQAMMDPADCGGPLGYPMYMYAGYGPYQPAPAAFCYQQQQQQLPPSHHQSYLGLPPLHQQQQSQQRHAYSYMHLGGGGSSGGSGGGGRGGMCPQTSGVVMSDGGPDSMSQPQPGGPEDSPEASGGGGPGDLQQHLCSDFSGMSMCHVLQRQA